MSETLRLNDEKPFNQDGGFEALTELSDKFDPVMARRLAEQEAYDRERIVKNQEVESNLNSRLLQIDDLETKVVSDDSEIHKHFVSFENINIPVYDLRGIPFSMLSTTIDYRSANKPGDIGTETFRKVLEDPAVWARRRDEVEKLDSFGTRDSDAVGDTISTSYWNSEKNIDSHVSGSLIYGFESADANSVLSISNGDGNTHNIADKYNYVALDLDDIKRIEGADGHQMYNEILLKRYTENGMPKKPDYIIVENGNFTKESLHHASYFGIPIVNVERSAYQEKSKQKGEEIINSISENDSYEEIDRKIAELLSISEYKNDFKMICDIGKGFSRSESSLHSYSKTPLEKIAEIEQAKRLEFVKDALEEATKKIESDTNDGVRTMSGGLPQFEDFNINIFDTENQTYDDILYSNVSHFDFGLGECGRININFRLKSDSPNIHTTVYDGERPFMANELIASGDQSIKKQIESADSSYYDALKPVVRKYLEAIRENKKSHYF